jgi:hypothetical protein
MSFNRDLGQHRPQLEQQNYLHLENVLSDRFKNLLEFYGGQIAANELDEIEEWHIPGKKRQFLFDFLSKSLFDRFREGLSHLTGEPHDAITIGERHIKVYLDEAPEYPVPHLDRQAAQYTIGFPIHIPEDSRVCFFPHLSRNENKEQRACYADMPADGDLENLYKDDHVVKLKGDIGDMIIFQGSTIFHERICPAGCRILYIKINAAGQDPLGEHASLLASLAGKPEDAVIN